MASCSRNRCGAPRIELIVDPIRRILGLAAAQESLHCISGSQVGTFTNGSEQLLGLLCSRLNFGRIEEIIGFGMHEFLDDIQLQLNRIGQAIFDDFFAIRPVEHLDPPRRSWLISGGRPNPKGNWAIQAAGGAE